MRESHGSPNSPTGPGEGRRTAPFRWPTVVVGVLVVAGVAGAAPAAAGVRWPAGGPLTLLFLLIAPAAATALVLRAMDPAARAVVSGAAALVVDAAVAETMLVTSSWSPRGGIVAVGAVSAAIAALAAVRGPHARGTGGSGAATKKAAADEDDDSWVFTD